MTDQTQDQDGNKNAFSLRKLWKRLTRLVNELGKGRLLITVLMLLVAILIAQFSWQVPLSQSAERSLYDIRQVNSAPLVDQDPRIVMIVYNDDTLIGARKRSPLDRGILAKALTNIDQMEPKAVGIDILFDQPQDEDDQLIAALRAMRAPTNLAYAETGANELTIRHAQQEFLDSFMATLKGSNARPASIRFQTDDDNVARSWPEVRQDLPPFMPKAMAGPAKQFKDYDRSISYRLPRDPERPVFSSFPIDLFTDPVTASALAEQVKGKYVLIGGDIVDTDLFDTPLNLVTGKPMIGLEVLASTLAQILDGRQPKPLPAPLLWALAIAVVLAGGMTSLLETRGTRTALNFAGQILVIGGLPFWLHASGYDTQTLPAFGWIIGWIIAFATVGTAARQVGSQQRKFAQSALGKYLPRDIANEILNEPDRLALHGEKREIFVVFTDLEGFTQMSHQIEPEMVATLLNRYLDMLCNAVLEYGGTIDKFVGDAVVAFWGAPISRPDDGERAARAAYAMWQAGEEFRNTAPPGLPRIGKTRVGLHFGEAVIGNFGGEGRIQYTALGDSMNTASRLESANKKLETSMIASLEAVERSGLDWWRPMGLVQLRGRAKPVEIYEPAPEMDESDAHHIRFIFDLLKTNHDEAVKALSALVARHPDDKALTNLLHRIEVTEPGGFYVVD